MSGGHQVIKAAQNLPLTADLLKDERGSPCAFDPLFGQKWLFSFTFVSRETADRLCLLPPPALKGRHGHSAAGADRQDAPTSVMRPGNRRKGTDRQNDDSPSACLLGL